MTDSTNKIMQRLNERVAKVINYLKKLKGLANFIFISDEDKKIIQELEDAHNLGVLEALKRTYTIACTHDTSFREPAGDIVAMKASKIILPPVPFPEVKARNVVSSSPGYKVDAYLRKKIRAKKDEATLIIGFD